MTTSFNESVTTLATHRGWATTPLKFIFRRSKKLGDGSEQLLSIYRDHGVIPKNSRSDNFNKASDDLSKYQKVDSGDLVINKMKAWQGSVAISKHTGIISPAYFVYRPMLTTGMNTEYLHYLLRSSLYFQHYGSISTGVRPNQWDLDPTTFERTLLLRPATVEQETIADYLNHETTEIDALVSDLSDILALLAERLTSAVQSHVSRLLLENRTPTQTMTPRGRFNAPAHPFGEQWISLGYLATVETGSMDTQDSQPDGDFPFFVRSDTVERTHSYTFDQEAILTAGDGAGVGKVFHHFQGRFAAHQRVYVITPKKVYGAFLYWILRGYFGAIILGGTAKSTVESLRRPMLTGFPVPDLSMQQQAEIARIMDSERNYVEMQIANVRCALALARERRAALITAAVTGQIDVAARHKPAAEQLEDDIAQGLHREN